MNSAELISEGDEFQRDFIITSLDVAKFIDASGDTNIIHTDAEAASQSAIHHRAVPGMISGMVFSRLLGTLFPGHGTVYRKQELKFEAPLLQDIPHVAVFRVLTIIRYKHLAVISTIIRNRENGVIITSGKATVLHNKKL